MDTDKILQGIDAEIARLQQVKVLLNGDSLAVTLKKPGRKMSAEARARIAAAQPPPIRKSVRSSELTIPSGFGSSIIRSDVQEAISAKPIPLGKR